MQEKHPSYLQRPPRWPCPFVECKCHRPGFRYKVHFLEHLEKCHRKWYSRAKAHPQILMELHNPRQIRDQSDKPLPWGTALDLQLRALERRAQRVAQARGTTGGGVGGLVGPGPGSTRTITHSDGQPRDNTVPQGNFLIPAYQPYYPQNAVYGGFPWFGANLSDYAPNVQHAQARGFPPAIGAYQGFYGTDLARTAVGPPSEPPMFHSRAMPVRGPNVSPSGSGSVSGDDGGTPGQQS